MDKVNVIFAVISAVSVFAAIFYSISINVKTKLTLNKMNDMVDSAINNNFDDKNFDETMLSALENKLYRFLTSSKSSQKNIEIEKDRIKSLISDISHQTKTPVSNILLYSQLLQEQEETSLEASKLINEIASQSEKLSFLIQSLVKTSRLESGIINVKPQLSAIKDVISSAAADVKNKAESKNITLNIAAADDIMAIFDRKWTEEAIYNILDNAVKYTPCEGKIFVSVDAYELFARIDITDTGIGIPQTEINNIFKRFYRSTNVKDYEGVGIGLYLSRDIISLQGGYIKVKSKQGRGTTFSVFLPKSVT